MSFEFPLGQRDTPFGPITNPWILVTVQTPAGPVTERFLVDTGADFCIAPRWLAERAGLNWDDLTETRALGVEQGGVTGRIGPLRLWLAELALEVRFLFLPLPNTPLVLGRADFLDRFVLTIDPGRRRIVLDEIQSS